MAEKRTTYKLQDVGGIGEVKIADEVVTVIAGGCCFHGRKYHQ